jgi:predicted TIM-barrel fold metal-dependent hydrolase
MLEAIDAFGPDRSMMESNFPIDNQSASFPVIWNAFKRVTSGFSPGERAAMFHGTAQRAYKLSTDIKGIARP